jgi:hypothetical protein
VYKRQYHADSDGACLELSRSFPGAFLKLEYMGVTDAYYQHWVETEGSGVKFHHVCRSALSSCK